MLASLCAGLAVLAPASASAFATPPSHTQAIDAPNSLNAVSCVPQTTDCVVSDSEGNALYSTNVSVTGPATWNSWSGPGVSPSQAVACPSSSLCVLADGVAEEPGVGGNMYYATSLGGPWKEAFEPVWGVVAVSCASTTLCVSGAESEGAIRYTSKPASGEWFALDDIGGEFSAMTGVACLSSFCAVVDSGGRLHVANTAEKITESPGWKSTDVDGTTPLHGVACTSTTTCFAVDGEGNVLDLTINSSGEATVSKHDIDGTNDLTAITCTEGFMCVAVDSKGNVFVSSDGGTTWSGQLALGGDLTSVSCASSSLCVAADTSGSATAFAPPLFPLTVFISGEGEVISTPVGVKCSTEECSYAFEGEVTLTEANAGAGYEFAGWLGCKRVSATTCTVDVTAASEVTAVFLKAGKEGAPGEEGPAGKDGATGNEGKTGATGEKGATGVAGPQGLAGAQGPAGPAGKIELVRCKTVKGKQHCTTKLVSGTIKFTAIGLAAQATLSRHGVVFASGSALATRERMRLRLVPLRRLRPGKYILTLISGSGKHKRISNESFTLS
jgi:hypothetical protein